MTSTGAIVLFSLGVSLAPALAVGAVRDPFEPVARVAREGEAGARLRLTGIMHSEARTVALLEDATGIGFIVEPGAILPTMRLRVVSVQGNAVHVERIDGGGEIVIPLLEDETRAAAEGFVE